MPYTLYGLKNCDRCRAAQRWLESQNIPTALHDLRSDPVPEELLSQWLQDLGWESLLNRRSTTWRQLDPLQREDMNTERAHNLMQVYPTLIKRPLMQINGQWVCGFSEAMYSNLLAGAD